MKNIIKHFGIIALVAIIGFTMIACDSGGGGKSSKNTQNTITNPADLTVNTSVADKKASDIPDFKEIPAYQDYAAMSKPEAEAIVTALTTELQTALDEFLNGEGLDGLFSKGSNYGRAAYGRATETIKIGLSDLAKEMELPTGTTLVGNIIGTVSFPDSGDFPMSANGSGKFRLEALQPVDTDDGSLVMGFAAGSASLNNVKINSEDSMSGSAKGTVTYAINFADKDTMKWVKLIGDITTSSDLGKQTLSFTAKFDAFGDGTTKLATKTITVNVSPTKAEVVVK